MIDQTFSPPNQDEVLAFRVGFGLRGHAADVAAHEARA